MSTVRTSTVRCYRDLVAWQKSMALVKEVYRYSQMFPKTEVYGLTAQIRRAVVSVPSNIAEGQGRLSTGEFKQFLGHARGSLLEVETQVLLAESLGYIDSQQSELLLHCSSDVGRVLNGLIASLPSHR